MKEIYSDDIAKINMIISPIMYLSILMPICLKFNMIYIIPIAIVIHTLLFWGLMLYKEFKCKN